MKLCLAAFLVVLSGATLMAHAGNGDLIVDGKLGVGTDDPQANIDVGHTGRLGANLGSYVMPTGTPRGYLLGWNKSSGAGEVNIIAMKGAGSVGGIQLQDWDGANLATLMTVQRNGNVGIGTMTPGAKLEVSYNNGASPAFNEHIRTRGNSYTTQIGEFVKSADVTSGTLISSTGSINQNIGSGGQTYFSYRWFSGLPITTDFSSVTPLMILTGTGNLGVGTTDPVAKLDVAGDIRANNFPQTSDLRFKKNLLPIHSPLDMLLNISGVTYEWKTDEYKDKGFPEGRHYGVIAQEIEKVLPEVVNTAPDGTKAVAYTEIIPILIEAIKEQQKRIEKQNDSIERQQSEILAIKRQMRAQQEN